MFSNLEIIDSEMHGWHVSPELEELAHANPQVEVGLVLAAMDAAGVDAIVAPQHDEFAAFAATRHPDRFASIVRAPAWLDPADPDLDEKVATLRQKPGVLGIRALISVPRSGESVRLLIEGGWEPLFKAAARHGVPVCTFISGNLPLVEGIVQRNPDLTLVIDHFGIDQPPLSVPAEPPWSPLPHLLKLAKYPNVAVKFSGAPTLSSEAYPFLDVWPYLRQVVEAFGPERLLWGSDITRAMGFEGLVTSFGVSVRDQNFPWQHTYADAIHYILDSSELSRSDKEWIFSRSLRRWLRWPAREPSASAEPVAR